MKNILLITQGASSSNSVIAEAAIDAGHGLRHAGNNHEAFEILAEDFDNIDVVIIDTDAGTHTLSLLDAISYRDSAPPVIVITGFEEGDIASMAYRHGATACIGKCFTARELAALIQDVTMPEWQQCTGTCDRWGHLCSGHRKNRKIGHTYEHVHRMSI